MLGDDLAQESRNKDSDNYSSWVGMVYPLLISSTMVLLTVKMHDLITVLEIWFERHLGCENYFMVYVAYINTLSSCGKLVMWMIRSDERKEK